MEPPVCGKIVLLLVSVSQAESLPVLVLSEIGHLIVAKSEATLVVSVLGVELFNICGRFEEVGFPEVVLFHRGILLSVLHLPSAELHVVAVGMSEAQEGCESEELHI